MEIQGKNYIGSELSNFGEKTFRAYDPRAGKEIDPPFHEATQDEVERALELADAAAAQFRTFEADRTIGFLGVVRREIQALGDQLVERAAQETGLDVNRLKGERERTLNQISLFVNIVKEGSWVDARIDTALPERKPLPRPDIRRMLQPIGPVAVFGASNFPLAFSVAGGDTISAFAARNPVIVKAHPAHPGTSELVASAIARAVKLTSMPEGSFSMVHGTGADVGMALATHAKTRAVAFTGSQRAGRALFNAAARRPEPIPVFAEMGSTNPVFVLPGALESDGQKVAEGLFRSVLMGTGQFCTSPGLVFGVESDSFTKFRELLIGNFEESSPGTMLNAGIRDAYAADFQKASQVKGVRFFEAARGAEAERTEGRPGILVTHADTWLRNEELHKEIFGPATVLVSCGS
ncbi:MAG: aldehyde dehydrogenase family protein, partial [Acidobacteriaceae bacterium]|nr:aldehyde dehydrogenase family protein [Acidobacteriaceae bacterium]